MLVEAGITLTQPLDIGQMLGRIARLTVPRLADLCMIDLREDNGGIRRSATAAHDPAIMLDLEQMESAGEIDPKSRHPVAQVMRSGQPLLLPETADGFRPTVSRGARHTQFIADRGYRSLAVAPLLARHRTLGTLSLARMLGSEPHSRADLEAVCELARQVALAIDNARLLCEAHEVEERLTTILVMLTEAITLTDRDDRIVYANAAAAKLFHYDSPNDLTELHQFELGERFLTLDEHGAEIADSDVTRRELFDDGKAEPEILRLVFRETGEQHWLTYKPAPIFHAEGKRVQFAVNVYEEITEVKRIQGAERVMAEAAQAIGSCGDLREALEVVAALTVPDLADWCAIDLLSETGEIERMAVHHSDPAKAMLVRALGVASNRRIDDQKGITAEVIRSGVTALFAQLTAGDLARSARHSAHVKLLFSAGATSLVVVPLMGAAGAIGTITFACAESLRRISPADVVLAEQLGRRVGAAVESARLNSEHTSIAHILQAALLPESLPRIPGMEVAARYSAAGEANDVGGDFYDAMPYGGNGWLFVIGDVCGKGPRAAGVTALARHTLRTAALLGQTPAGMLATLHHALRAQPPGADLCTVGIVTLRRLPAGARLTVTLAGHLPPLLIGTDGQVQQLGTPGTLLGVLDPLSILEVESELRAGETLLLYTDGLPEAGHDGARLGEAGLARMCADGRTLPIEDFLTDIEQIALQHAEGRLSDDIALLALRLST